MNWPALLVAPSLVLVHLTAAYALATPSCATQRELATHAVAVLCLAAAAACTALAWRSWRAAGSPPARFHAQVALGVGALSCLVIVALWVPPWWLSPCWS
jgi:hypothetical protein